MAQSFTESMKTGTEQLFLPSQIKSTIVNTWFNLLRSSLSIEISDNELLSWLNIFLESFFEELNNELDENPKKDMVDIIVSLQKAGLSSSDLIETILLFSSAIRSVEISHMQAPLGDEISTNKPLSILANRVIADKLAYLLDRADEAQSQSQDRMTSLLRLAKECSSSLNLQKVLQSISQEIIQALDAQAVNSFLFPDRSMNGHYYLLNNFSLIGYKVPDPPELFTLQALQQGKPITCYDAALDPLTDKKTVEFFGLKSLMAFPIISRGKTIAAGLIVMKDYHHFTQREIDLVMGIANSGAIAVENARNHENSLQTAIAQERNFLAREIHDRMAQNLAVIKINLNLLMMENSENSDNEKLLEIKTLVDETSQDMRDAIYGLRLFSNSEYSSFEDFKDYIVSFGTHRNIIVQYNFDETDLQQLSGEAVLQIGRIIEEAVVNSCKHSKAKNIWINSQFDEGRVGITIEDDGIGINLKTNTGPADGHFGLKIMEERAGSIGGKLEIKRSVKGGTLVSLIIPIGMINQYEQPTP